MNKVFPANAVVLHVVEAELQSRQVFVGDVEATVFADPVSETVDRDVACVVPVHVGEETLSVKLKLVNLLVELSIGLDEETE